MDRRKSLKILAGTVTTTAFLDACKTDDKKIAPADPAAPFDPKVFFGLNFNLQISHIAR